MTDNEARDPFAKLGRFADELITSRKAGLKRLREGEDLESLDGDFEPVPVGKEAFSGMYTGPRPFGSPPDEPVEIDGEVPWELRDDEANDD